MGLSDERKDSSATQQSNLGGGKDLLYGWLIGRATADLGLAQALTASEAQRGEQIKRLEDSLLGQIRELQNSPSSSLGAGAAELDALKLEIERVSERQRQLAADQANIEQLEAAMSAKFHEFESQIQRQSQSVAGGDFADIKFELKLLTDRIARAEYAAQQAQAYIASDKQRVEDSIADRVKTETAALKAQMVAELDRAPAIAQSVAANWQKKLDELGDSLGQGAQVASGLEALQNDLAQLSERLGAIESAPSVAAGMAEQASRRSQEIDERMARLEQTAQSGAADLKVEIGALKTRLNEPGDVHKLEETWSARIGELHDKLSTALSVIDGRTAEMRGIEAQTVTLTETVLQFSQRAEVYAARARELESRLREKLEIDDKSGVGLGQVQIEMSALAHRLEEIDLVNQQAHALNSAEAQRAEQAADGLRAELEALKAAQSRQNIEPVQALIGDFEATFGAKLSELQNCLAGEQLNRNSRDRLLGELRDEVHSMAQRLIQAESSAQQTHALIVIEAAQAAQWRDGMMGELAALQAQLAAEQANGARIDGLGEELRTRIFEVQNQLSQKIALLGSRDGEIAELKIQIQNLTEMAVQKNAAQAAAVNRLQSAIVVKAPGETTAPALKPAAAASETNSMMHSFDAEAGGSNEQRKQLQQRLSADIERVRAELRKRAGVSR